MMTRPTTIALMLLMLMAASVVCAQNTSEKSQIRVRGRGSRLILTSRGVRRSLEMREHIFAAKLDDVGLLFANRKQPFIYLVVAACGSSKLVPDDRQCGAGVECNLMWMKLDRTWKLKDIKSVRYESCWMPVTSTDGYKISGNTLQLEYDDFRTKMTYKLSYDANRPESGFAITESAMTDASSG